MKEIDKGFSPDKGTVCALGLFDGVHRGHRLVINNALSLAEKLGVRSAVFTFRTDTVTSKGHDGRIEMILSDAEKCRHFEDMGVDLLYSPDFNELKNMSAEAFVRDILSGLLGCRAVVCGSDFRFGKGAEGDCNTLELYGRIYGIDVMVCDKLSYKGEEVSSTVIRECIRTGQIEKANELLGYIFGLKLVVEHGRQLGRTWNFPTINQTIPRGQILPKFGVYATRVMIDGKSRFGVTNIGVKPTLKAHDAPLAETYILDFSGDLYGREIEILLDKFIRPEKGFDSIDELKAQIGKDTLKVREFYGVDKE
ncbi:riboflavin biosynthesis protein RibF [Ruminococcus albus]|uniref:Riboflavin biosynthesis protein n=1 Tax=Ruminococcus albus (strain ATCC 27210 / DSM 20455 / JCM 14654 / NCDO 2250 / 7) TaxID=697329 RepID=E6UE93_RUMA7|nr:riboflavin biosynthesis protein RibF [Ruminococcus albus]ADU23483.1 riboflavin biosynthesis protein RibF [Ruminococcus albus 7 = DSM 20455]